MKFTGALRVLAALTSQQWGMVTSAQASARGVSRLDLSRLAEAGHLIRIAHGVYMDAGAPGDEFDDLRAAWLSTDPKRLAEERVRDPAGGVVIAGESATRLHTIGDFRAARHDFVSPARRQSQRREIRYRQRRLDPGDVVLVEGMPTMSIERTIADLVEDLKDLSLIADALRDASRRRILDLDRLRDLLAPLAERNSFRKGDGGGLLHRLIEIAGLDIESFARRVASDPPLGARIAADYIGHLGAADLRSLIVMPEMEKSLRSFRESLMEAVSNALSPQLKELKGTSMELAASLADSVGVQDTIREILAQFVSADLLKALSEIGGTSQNQRLASAPRTLALIRDAERAARDD
ncbi:MAG TPA: type IV toxin-antitoxin system AbiEi family antitoxin domain-containing protein [Intrasporangium sp.]|uniref:type IV toxin-antitoxin system AbiEi family antitoxin domain-containing protein n=1 Tax=Intrasporangium sp. TaxID=1925024 RepID=UPI002D77659F|nr:type IV toxin-antitoxin system AbiEi family antitoxin domain-containing protein [Intrasporangium sp.]HET7398151.1 type IV toxin-antitoxin system AbiEi family antitoxin domain-containing protein [Intrasporangium sp.]